MDRYKTEVKVREEIVHDLTKSKTFYLDGEAGWKIKKLKQKVGDVSFPLDGNAENVVTTLATTFILSTKIARLSVIIPCKGKWMMTYHDTFEFKADVPGVAEFKVIIWRKEPNPNRQRNSRARY